jgi:hypothetical protein
VLLVGSAQQPRLSLRRHFDAVTAQAQNDRRAVVLIQVERIGLPYLELVQSGRPRQGHQILDVLVLDGSITSMPRDG